MKRGSRVPRILRGECSEVKGQVATVALSSAWRWVGIGAVFLALGAMACSSAATTPPATPTAASTSGETGQPPEPTPTVELEVGGQVGNRAPEFTVKLADGSQATLASLLEGGKPLLLYFMATW